MRISSRVGWCSRLQIVCSERQGRASTVRPGVFVFAKDVINGAFMTVCVVVATTGGNDLVNVLPLKRGNGI